MAKYRAMMIKTVTYAMETVVDAEDDFGARNVACAVAVEHPEAFQGYQFCEDWDFSYAEKFSD